MNEIICADCLEVLKSMPDKSVDLVLTDPPYGIGIGRDGTIGGQNLAAATQYPPCGWDKQRVDKAVFDEMVRVSREQVVFGGNYYSDYLPPSSSWIVWDKQNTGNFADCELAWTSHHRAVRIVRHQWNGFIREGHEERFHPTQKPIEVMRWIVANYSEAGDTILDPFCGSGTTCVAAKILGRKYIGIEISPVYAEIARKRVEQAQYEERLFAVNA